MAINCEVEPVVLNTIDPMNSKKVLEQGNFGEQTRSTKNDL